MKIIDKIKDMQDVRKYKRKANTEKNKYDARNEQYITALETIQMMAINENEKDKQITKLKEEIKKLKKMMEEDMIPKKKRD